MRRITARYLGGEIPALELRGDVDSALIEKMRDYDTLIAFNREAFTDSSGVHEPYVQILVRSSDNAFRLAMRIRDDLKKREQEISFTYVAAPP